VSLINRFSGSVNTMSYIINRLLTTICFAAYFGPVGDHQANSTFIIHAAADSINFPLHALIIVA
jgi:hypothetical protein